MHGLSTMEKINSEAVMESYLSDNPLKRIKKAEDTFKAPDYSAVDLELLESVSGKEVVETYFVDSSGFGDEREPAMTVGRFTETVSELLNTCSEPLYAVLSGIGQFQVYVTVLKG